MTPLVQNVEQTRDTLVLPASDGQQRFWVLDQIKRGDPSLNVAVRFGLRGPLDPAALEAALNLTVQRHEILRANFALVDGEVSQVVLPERPIALPFTDLASLPAPQRDAESDRWADSLARDPFTIDNGPLIRARLLRLAAEEHVLLITVHHIVSDGWSIGIITDELGAFYESLRTGRPAAIEDLPIQFADYVLWRREQDGSAEAAEAEDYWRNRLAALPHFEVIPDFPRESGTWPGHIVSRLLPTALTGDIEQLARRHRTTLFTAMYAGLAALLNRYTGEDDIVIGSQVAGRDIVDVEPLIGPFVNTLVLRTSLDGDPSFVELLERARDTVSGALSYQLPFDRVAEILRLERSVDRNLLFQVNFIHQRDFVKPWNHAGLSMYPIPSRSPGAMYDLNFFLVERADGWRLSAEYNASLYRTSTVETLLENYERLLREIAREPYQRTSEFRFLSPAEEMKVLVEWNRTEAPYPRDARIHDLLEKAAERAPAQTAVVFEGAQTDYDTLNRRANQMARYLRHRGAGHGSIVGICLHRSSELLVAVLAALKAGCAYVPLDPSFPPDRLAFMGEDARMRLIVTTRALAGFGGEQAGRVLIDTEAEAIGGENSAHFDGGASPDDTAYILYTSGSTGKPKGVEVTHRSVINLLYAIQANISIGPRDTLLAITTLSFDIAALELFLPLLTGARILLASQAQASDPALLLPLLDSGVTVMQATPVTWRMLIDAGWRRTPGLKMLCGGESMSRALADSLLDRGGRLWNVYGPTETTIWSTIAAIDRDSQPVTIGRPLANTQLYVLDPTLTPVPVGVPGELYIGGDGVARGYLNRPELTAQRFIPNPFAPGRLYRTGDRVRSLPDGRIEMLGRNDDQVKIRGFRIELGEVEAALAACPGVRSAAIAVRKDAAGADILAGYFVPRVPGDLSPSAVRIALCRSLPEYMIPTALVPMPRLPVTPNGKVDRKALPAPEVAVLGRGTPAEGPSDALEATLTGIWESVLGVRPVHVTDNFFALGGHSVLAARMFARMEKAIGKVLPLATLFQAPTVRQLAAVIRDTDWTPLWSSLVPIRPAGSKPPFFFVHPIGGNVLNFAGFCGHFDADQPIYGIQARGLDGKEAPRVSIEDMAAAYVESVRAVQPQGPYFIGGFSAGAIVAFEMGRALEAQGHQVALLALLDSKLDAPSPSNGGSLLAPVRRAIRVARFNARYATRISPASFIARKWKNLKMRANVRRWIVREALGLGNNPSSLGAEEGFMLALRRYTASAYNGNATLFRAREELVRFPDPFLGWRPYVRGTLEIQEISGDHDNILLEPHIGMLANKLEACLRRARSEKEHDA